MSTKFKKKRMFIFLFLVHVWQMLRICCKSEACEPLTWAVQRIFIIFVPWGVISLSLLHI
jgi:hypothetical protein